VAEAAADTRIVVLVRTTAKSSKSSADFLQGTARIIRAVFLVRVEFQEI